MATYNFKEVEAKWSRRWQETGLYKTDLHHAKNPYYLLMMFPYPSAEGMHVGNAFAFVGPDAYGRYHKRLGNDLFEPMGFDSFGIHSENYAIKKGTHPATLTDQTIKYFRDEQFKKMGMAIDWDHEVITSHPDYYKWTQWLFVQLFKAGLAYQKEAPAQWCPSCLTVLADEQVIAGKCERCNSEVTTKVLKQWFFKITDYAEKLLQTLEVANWSETTKTMQRNWIGKSEGAQVKFSTTAGGIEVFTTRPDTLWGATFMVLAPEHPFVKKLTTPKQREVVEGYVDQSLKKTELERISNDKDKTGVFIGSYATNPVNGEQIPIWVSDYVLLGYGTGAIMAVPAHDQRDWEFAIKFKLPIVEVISGGDITKGAYTGEGILVNSGEFNGTKSTKAISKVIHYLQESGLGKAKTTYHLRDWLISRQRYWGPPIPIIYCAKCGTVAVPEKDLPVKLPFIEDFKPTGTGQAPLANDPDFVNVTCPQCGGAAKRETDVSDTFLDSSWYFLRYPSTEYDDRPFDAKMTAKWLPVDFYSGGNEHAVLHLLYTRFITLVLKDLGMIDLDQPFKRFRARGMVIKEGAKMSKSRGNIVSPNFYIEKYGADTLRMALLFMVPYEQGGDFQDRGVSGVFRYLNRVVDLVDRVDNRPETKEEIQAKHRAIQKVTTDIEVLSFNTAVAALMEYTNILTKTPKSSKSAVLVLVSLLSVFAPHLGEELWERLGQSYSVHTSAWPEFDPSQLTVDEQLIVVQVNGKLRDRISAPNGSSEDDVKRLALASPKVSSYTEKSAVVKIIFVPGKLINFVLSEG